MKTYAVSYILLTKNMKMLLSSYPLELKFREIRQGSRGDDIDDMAIGNKGEISFKKLDENRKIGFKGTQENE